LSALGFDGAPIPSRAGGGEGKVEVGKKQKMTKER